MMQCIKMNEHRKQDVEKGWKIEQIFKATEEKNSLLPSFVHWYEYLPHM
jgi:hypothetical protein